MNINGLVTETKAKFDHNLAKHYLKEKYTAKLIFADQGGLWKASPEFLTFLSSKAHTHSIILDLYENPIKVDKEVLSMKAHQTYNTVMSEWHEEWTNLQKNR